MTEAATNGRLDVTGASSDSLTRGELAITVLLAAICGGATLTLYYAVPLLPRTHQAVWWRLISGLVLFGVVLAEELNAILRHHRPMRRAFIALAVVLPIFVVTFAWIYVTIADSNPAAFGDRLTRTQALYFTMSVLSTVGFGDITPHTDSARLVVTIQMVSDFIVLAVVVRLILDVASRATARRRIAEPPITSETS